MVHIHVGKAKANLVFDLFMKKITAKPKAKRQYNVAYVPFLGSTNGNALKKAEPNFSGVSSFSV